MPVHGLNSGACTGIFVAHHPFNDVPRGPLMRLLLALLLPWFQFFTIGRPIAGIICLLLQLTVIGWLPAAIWSVYALSQYKTDRKIDAALRGRP
jgi:uncharacterized membrane protein YqaE (UPF0057 family)